ncbi:MAG: sodium:solute symporter [Calditrichia bacterium]
MANLATIDLSIIILYFIATISIGLFYSRKQSDNSESFFLAGRSLGWIAIGASLFAANISSEHFIGLAGLGAAHGLAVGSFEWLAVFWLILLGWLFAPLFLREKVFTIPQFLEKRFGRAVKKYLAGISIFAYILTKISVTLYAGGLLLKYVFDWDLYTSTMVMVLLTGIYTIVGGLTAVVYTSVFQTFVLIVGTLLVTGFGLQAVGGFTALKAQLPADFFTMLKPASDPNFPWTGIVFGAPILGVWYWCTDQYIVQRVLAAKNLNQARAGTVFAGFLKLTPIFLLVLPGMMAVLLFPGIKGDEAFPNLVASSLLPVGVRGIVISGLLAALMSSLSSFFHSTATLFTIDFYLDRHPEVSQRKLVLVGRLTTMLIVLSAILWVPFTKLITTDLYIYLQSIQAYISPPIAAVFLIGIFWKRINGFGAFWTMVAGGVLGGVRLVLEILLRRGVDIWPGFLFVVRMHFLHFAVYLFGISVLLLILFSELYRYKKTAPDEAGGKLESFTIPELRTVWGQTFSTSPSILLSSGVLVASVIGLWLMFG